MDDRGTGHSFAERLGDLWADPPRRVAAFVGAGVVLGLIAGLVLGLPLLASIGIGAVALGLLGVILGFWG